MYRIINIVYTLAVAVAVAATAAVAAVCLQVGVRIVVVSRMYFVVLFVNELYHV